MSTNETPPIPDVEITEDDIKEALKRPDDFAYWGGNRNMFTTWSYGPVVRNSYNTSAVHEANLRSLLKQLEAHPELEEDWELTEASHWASKSVTHLVFKVLNDDGTPSDVFKIIKAHFDSLEDYPVADENILSEVEMEQQGESWDGFYANEFREALKKKFVNVLDYELPAYDILDALIDTLDVNGGLYDIFRAGQDASNTEWIEYSDGWSIDLDRIMEDTTWQMVVEGFANDLTYARSEGYREVTKANRLIIKSAGPDNDTVQLVVPGKLSDNPAFDATPEVIEPGRTIYSLKFMGLFSEDKS